LKPSGGIDAFVVSSILLVSREWLRSDESAAELDSVRLKPQAPKALSQLGKQG
jgi:hypothetical protein